MLAGCLHWLARRLAGCLAVTARHPFPRVKASPGSDSQERRPSARHQVGGAGSAGRRLGGLGHHCRILPGTPRTGPLCGPSLVVLPRYTLKGPHSGPHQGYTPKVHPERAAQRPAPG